MVSQGSGAGGKRTRFRPCFLSLSPGRFIPPGSRGRALLPDKYFVGINQPGDRDPDGFTGIQLDYYLGTIDRHEVPFDSSSGGSVRPCSGLKNGR